MKRTIFSTSTAVALIMVLLAGSMLSCTDIQGDGIDTVIWEGSVLPEDSCYRNPVWEPDLSYPTVFSAAVGYFAFGTSNEWSPGLEYTAPVLSSNDLMNWRLRGEAFNEKPDWSDAKISRISAAFAKTKGAYYVFYQLDGDIIGMSGSKAPQGPYVDFGQLISADDLGVASLSNPFFFPFGSSAYLYYNDGTGMSGVQLTLEKDTIASIKGDPFKVAGAGISSMNMMKWGNYYYLFAVAEDGDNSTVGVARSGSVDGPFLDKDGQSLLDGTGTPLLTGSAEEGYVAVNHVGGVFEDSNGELWILYQVTDVEKPELSSGTERHPLMLTKLKMDEDGWPTGTMNPLGGWNYPKVPR